MKKEELINLLDETERETLGYFSLNDTDLSKTYGTSKWNIRQIMHHLADCEIMFHARIKKIIAEPKQVIYAFMQDEWAACFKYKDEPIADKSNVYLACRALNKQLINQFYDSHKDKEFVHSETGLRTLLMEFEKVAVHNLNHLVQIRTALAS